jgi:hypothetical protein
MSTMAEQHDPLAKADGPVTGNRPRGGKKNQNRRTQHKLNRELLHRPATAGQCQARR